MSGELIDRCRHGDERAWREVVVTYERLVFSIPLNLGLGPDDAADVTQATFGVLLGALDSINDPDRLGGWLATVARRQSIRVIEQRDRDRRRGEAVAGHEPTIVDDTDAHRVTDDIEWLHQALARVSPRCREVVVALYFTPTDGAGPVYATVAERLGIPIGSLGPTRQRCLAALRRALDELDDDSAAVDS